MSQTIIAVIQACPITLERNPDGSEIVTFTADADIDCDGTGGNPYHDPYFQPDTTLHNHGLPLCAEKENYVVVPPIIRQKTKGVVLGSSCEVVNLANQKRAWAVVGDIGPRTKIGEISVALAEALGLSGNPNTGGTDKRIIQYTIFVGQAAEGYALQPA